MNLRFRFWCALILCGLGLQSVSIFAASTKLVRSAEADMAQGSKAFEAGAFEEAVTHWQKAQQLFGNAKVRAGQIDATIQLAAAYQTLGQTKLAVEQLTDAIALAESAKDRARLARAKDDLGLAYSTTRRTELAEANFRQALAIAEEDQDWNAVAVIDNNIGNLRMAQERFAEALDAFRESAALARQNQNRLLSARALANAASAAERSV